MGFPRRRARGEPRLSRLLALLLRHRSRNLLGFFDFPGHDHPEFSETIGNVQHIAISVDEEQFKAAKQRFDEAGLDYLGPDRGVENSLYVRDPNGTGIELYCERIGVFEGDVLIPEAVAEASSGSN